MGSFFYTMQKCKDKVAYLLKEYPECRDDDKKLLAYYQWYALKLSDKISKEDFYKRTQFHKIESHESITRARRKWQEEVPELRGKKYNERHRESVDMRENINNF